MYDADEARMDWEIEQMVADETRAKAELEIVRNAVTIRDLLPDDVTIVPTDCDTANHPSGGEDMPDA